MKTSSFTLLLAALITVFLTSSSSSCSKEDKTPAPDLSKGYPDAFTNKMSPKKLANLKKAGATIYEGQDPPALDGIFKAVEFIYSDSDGIDVGEKLTGFTDFQFSKFEDHNKQCLIDWAQWNDKDGSLIGISEGGGKYFPMAGHGNNFTVDAAEQITDAKTGKKYDYYSFYSGQVTADGIRNWESGLYEVDQNDNITWIRIFHDTDNFLPREIVKPGGRLSARPVADVGGKSDSQLEQLILHRHR
ncbi:hypothetical protein [Spirosoma panaciterrae]|uniref:hypothetical protein n=1 Tax=Spirosoma panaciterrae TaxID=496058 RepID=UPI00036E360E|nr:hypothetical protein [Spirosoma panaciterrae]